jgi:hypothetical protein
MPCVTELKDVQRAAIKSWEQLVPKPSILVLSDCIPTELNGRVVLRKVFDTSFDDLPLFSGMLFATIKTAAVHNHAVVAWVNADILLAPNVGSTISAAFHSQKLPWLMLGSRHNVPHSKLRDMRFAQQNLGASDNDKPFDLDEFITKNGVQHTTGGVDLFVWNDPHIPIVRAPYPPFIRTANVWDNWWVIEASATRLVVDGARHLTLGHIEHVRYDNNGEVVEAKKNAKKELLSPWSSSSFSDWHNFHNRALLISDFQRGYTRGFGTPNHIPVQVMADSNAQNGISFGVATHRKTNLAGTLRVSRWRDKQMEVFSADPTLAHSGPDDRHVEYVKRGQFFGIPHNLTSLLSTMNRNKPVVLTGTTIGFIPFIMSWVCNLKRIGEFENVLIAAFDEASYQKLFLLGMPVFIPGRSLGKTDGGPGSYSYGNAVYKQVTKMKTSVVLDVLKHNVDVIWCDPDVVLYKPFSADLMASMYDVELQNNNPTSLNTTTLSINSGFYRVRSVPWVIAALTAVVVHAGKSAASEHMSWDSVLCAEQMFDNDECHWQGHASHFLPQAKFATGNENDNIWKAVRLRRPPDALIAWHNNWISGYEAKMKRLVSIKQMWWDEEWGHCSSEYERRMMSRYFKQHHLTSVHISWGDWPRFDAPKVRPH